MDTSKLRASTLRKYTAMQKRFNHLYNVERIRYDDCVQKLMDEFYFSHKTKISQILCASLPEAPAEVDPKQMNIFQAGVPDILPMPLAATG